MFYGNQILSFPVHLPRPTCFAFLYYNVQKKESTVCEYLNNLSPGNTKKKTFLKK